MDLKKIIKNYLTKARNECEYKIAHSPKGWVSVNIEKVSNDLAEEIKTKG